MSAAAAEAQHSLAELVQRMAVLRAPSRPTELYKLPSLKVPSKSFMSESCAKPRAFCSITVWLCFIVPLRRSNGGSS